MQSVDAVLTILEGRVLRVVVNRPERRNALSRAVLGRLKDVFSGIPDDGTVACAILTGAGDACFAAGGDLRELDSVRTIEDASDLSFYGAGALDAIRYCPVPVMAVLLGDALGGGAELALACDWRAMREGTKIGFIHGRLKITSAWGGGIDLVDLVGTARALRMTARCELVPADVALQWGIADLVAGAGEIDARVSDFIKPLLAQSPKALRACKAQVVARRQRLSLNERRGLETSGFASTWVHRDHWAAVSKLLDGQRTLGQ